MVLVTDHPILHLFLSRSYGPVKHSLGRKEYCYLSLRYKTPIYVDTTNVFRKILTLCMVFYPAQEYEMI